MLYEKTLFIQVKMPRMWEMVELGSFDFFNLGRGRGYLYAA